MKTRTMACLLLVASIGLCCSTTTEREEPVQPTTDEVASDGYLPPPFSADQIREAWSEGLVLRIRQTTPDDVELQRWTVVAADEDGADIEYASIDEAGFVLSEPRVERSSWIELRDHATFAVETASRERTSRETALGTHEGWLYVDEDPSSGTVSEFFFAESMPGAPMFARTLQDGELLVEMEQVGREYP